MKQISAYAFIILTLVFQLALPCNSLAEKTGEMAPEFSLDDIHGKPHSLSDYRGSIVILNFWATWCPECVTEMPSLNALYEKYRGMGLVVLGIAADRKKDTVVDLLKKTPVSYPLLLDTKGGVFIRQYIVIGLPTTVIIDRSGRVAEKIVGRTDFGSASFGRKLQDLQDKGRTK